MSASKLSKKNISPEILLAKYLSCLESNPILTKAITSGVLAGSSEFVASFLSGASVTSTLYLPRSKSISENSEKGESEISEENDKKPGWKKVQFNHYLSSRIPKQALFGLCVSGPLSHFLIGELQRRFANKPKTLPYKVLQIICNNTFISPIYCILGVLYMTLITRPYFSLTSIFTAFSKVMGQYFNDSKSALRASLLPMLKTSWISNPVAMGFAQAFLPQNLWVPFFSFMGFLLGTYNNYLIKGKLVEQKRLQEKKRKEEQEEKEK